LGEFYLLDKSIQEACPQNLRKDSTMQIMETALPEIKVVMPRRIGDARGFFSEVWNARDFAASGIDVSFVQDNHARNPLKGTLRGLHYQVPPAAQGKLVRVTRGAIFDVAVDIRRGSPSFGRHAAAVLTADNWYQLWIPPGYAHGYCTLEDDTEGQCKTAEFYSPARVRTLPASPSNPIRSSTPNPAGVQIRIGRRQDLWPELAVSVARVARICCSFAAFLLGFS
jgi:dTDP-4-dehydrorhamnose 3,5-epimerase